MAAERAVEIQFDAVVGNETFACGHSYGNIGVTHSAVTPTDLRFFVSAVTLMRTDGTAIHVKLVQDDLWQYEDVALLDFEDGSGPCRNGTLAVNRTVRGTVPDGDYQGLTFVLGVPFELNHDDVTIARSPLNLTSMFWVWNAGHKFLKLDMATSGQPDARVEGRRSSEAKTQAVGFPVHIGSTGCAPGSKTTPPRSCKAPNRATVKIAQFDVERDIVVADVAVLLKNADVDKNTPDTAPGCMSEPNDPDCAPVFAALGLASEPQQMFTVRRRAR